ncbi:ribose 5-phosphate isomerase A-domain-containing protein [Fomitopsis serialis]|uniref:ribose 5-phosphate isomerase A-domain-containing protein n=1 Tax=Fomitopsis serialis TaxID=139415 RepID=UPI0020073C2F|nr:ribose 5-phosphate isomerase A-domain-containing protein [Neoantrodia serialis]KAH9918076.1 ribose 5-phosphate isomerase A-domain-containing protein [Neoantrodia serialis]
MFHPRSPHPLLCSVHHLHLYQRSVRARNLRESVQHSKMPIPPAILTPDLQTPSENVYPSPLRQTLNQSLLKTGSPPALISPHPKVPPPTTVIEASKRLAAWTAVDRHVKPDDKVIGIGSGSTVPYVVERIVAQGAARNKDRVFIPTSFQSKELIVSAQLLLGDVDQYPVIDVTIDGADSVDETLNCIKGGGACHLREKVLAEAADTFIVVADYRKDTDVLGKNFQQGVPIEVAQFAYAKVLQNVHLVGSPNATLRMAKSKAGPVVTDNGNFEMMRDPYTLLTRLKMLTGVVEVGLFCHMAKAAYFGNQDGSVTVKWHDGRIESIDSGNSPLPRPIDTPLPQYPIGDISPLGGEKKEQGVSLEEAASGVGSLKID